LEPSVLIWWCLLNYFRFQTFNSESIYMWFWEHIYVNIQFLSIFWFYLSIFLLFGLDVYFFPFVSYFDLLILLFDIICFDVEVVVLILMIWLISLLGFQLFSKFYFRDKFYFLFDCVYTRCFAFRFIGLLAARWKFNVRI
jgi:hypothetical protein